MPVDSKQQPLWAQPPRKVPDAKVNPQTTTLPLNDEPISHLSEWQVNSGIEGSGDSGVNLNFSGTLRLDHEIIQSLSRDQVFTSDYRSSFLQLRTVRTRREVSVERRDPQTMTGLSLQMSLVADCFTSQTQVREQCSYTPGLVTDRTRINPDFLVPTRLDQTAKFGEVVTPESLAAMRQPGFQGGANG